MIEEFPGWVITAGAGGGYIAYRTVLVPRRSGLSNVRCGATLEELYEHLHQELRGQNRHTPASRPVTEQS
ncbi:hypothetical protein AB0I81_41160 [Nonomuraea sp. NPDC050404]|uniref:hypothetical protein n=1 Tax=Nonomuraea sp. NPDC050404 TaxID=3155783 RepID=UPI003405F188